MEIVLWRKIFNANSTEGNLYVNGKWFSHVIEDKVRAKPGEWTLGSKVYGKTAIPYGRYPVLATWSNRFKRILTLIYNVPDFSGIRIHNGTTELSSAGCPIISYKNVKGMKRLENDITATNDLCEMVKKAQLKGKIFITITDTKPDFVI